MSEKENEFSPVIPSFRCLWDTLMETFSHIVGRSEDFLREKLKSRNTQVQQSLTHQVPEVDGVAKEKSSVQR